MGWHEAETDNTQEQKERGIIMAKKSNTTTAKGTTATTNNTTNTTTMNNKKEATTMENTVNTTAATVNTTAMSAQEFKQKSYDAYLAYVSFIEGQKSIADTVEALSPLMSAYCPFYGNARKRIAWPHLGLC